MSDNLASRRRPQLPLPAPAPPAPDLIRPFRVAFFNQAKEVDQFDQNPDISPCFAFSLLWIAHHKKYKLDSKSRLDWMRSQGTVRLAINEYKYMKPEVNRNGRNLFMARHFKGYFQPSVADLELIVMEHSVIGSDVQYSVVKRGVTETEIVAGAVCKPNQYFMIFLNCMKNPNHNHAISGYAGGDKVIVFDPNCGEHLIDAHHERFRSFFRLLRAEYASEGTEYTSFDVAVINDLGYMPR
jgi:hypothetical protein